MSISLQYLAIVAVLLAGTSAVPAQSAGKPDQAAMQSSTRQQSNAQQNDAGFAAVTLSNGTTIANPASAPALNFTDAQRAQIKAAIDRSSTAANFPLGTEQAASSFKPAVGAGVPSKMKGQTFPAALTEQIPVLKQYEYIKMADQAVLVDPMTHKVAAIIALP